MLPSRTTRTAPTAKLAKILVGSRGPGQGRNPSDDVVGGGLEIALMVPVFLGLGYLLDRWLGTAPIFMIVMVVLGVIGVFCRLRYAYDERMARTRGRAPRQACRHAAGRSEAVTAPASPFVTQLDGPAPEVSISKDMIRRGLIVAPLLVAVCGVIWGWNGACRRCTRSRIVLVNFALAAAIVATTARISLGFMMGAVLFGYLIRLGLILLAVVAGQGRRLDFASGPRDGHHRHALGAPRVGAQVPRHLARPPWAQAHSSLPAKEHRARCTRVPDPINTILRWQDLFPTFNKIALIACRRRR